MGDSERLAVRRLPPRATAGVLLLHGGPEQGLRSPSRLNLAGWRMRPFLRSLARTTEGHPVALAEVRYRHRGWNGDRADAAHDAADAVAELSRRTGGAPIVLVGHSMGGRAALRAAVDPGVTGVVALAAWCPPGEPVAELGGTRLVFAHARTDRVTPAAESLRMAADARAAGALVCRYELPDGDHGMLRDAGLWHALTTGTVCALLGLAPLPPEAASAFALPPDSPDGLTLAAASATPPRQG